MFVVEFEGHNDGHPYVASSHIDKSVGMRNLIEHRKENGKVRYRLIEIIEDWK